MLLYLSLFTILMSSILTFFNWKSNKNTLYLSFVFILTSLFGIGHHYITWGNSEYGIAIFYNHFSPLMFLTGPFLYFYIRNTLKNRSRLVKKDWWHFIPASIAFIGTIPYYFQPFEKKLEIASQIIKNIDAIREIEVNLFYTIEQSFVLRMVSTLLYLFYSFYLLWRFSPSKTQKKQSSQKQDSVIYRWLIFLLSNFLFICISFTVLAINAAVTIPSESIHDGYLLYIMAGVSYCTLIFSLFLFPEILYGITVKRGGNGKKIKNKKVNLIVEQDPLFTLSASIEKYLQEKKPFLNHTFSMSTIALDLKIPQNQVAYCIKHLMKIKFSELKNQLRIAHALELLNDSSNSILTIEAIGKQSGFKTRSYFYTAFKKEIGCTPSEYVQNRE